MAAKPTAAPTAIAAILPGFPPVGGGEDCPRAGSGLGVTLAVLVIVVPFCVTVMTDGTRLGASVGKGVGEGVELVEDVTRVLDASEVGDVRVGVGVGVSTIVVETIFVEATDS